MYFHINKKQTQNENHCKIEISLCFFGEIQKNINKKPLKKNCLLVIDFNRLK